MSVFAVIATLPSVLVSVLYSKLFAVRCLKTFAPPPTLLAVMLSLICISVPLVFRLIAPELVIVLNSRSLPLDICLNTWLPLPRLVPVLSVPPPPLPVPMLRQLLVSPK